MLSFFLCVCVCNYMQMSAGTKEVRRWHWIPPELQLKTTENHHVGVGTKRRSCTRAASALSSHSASQPWEPFSHTLGHLAIRLWGRHGRRVVLCGGQRAGIHSQVYYLYPGAHAQGHQLYPLCHLATEKTFI